MSKLHINEDADALISGRSPHPLLSFQQANLAALQLLGALILTNSQLIEDPFGCYERFTTYLTEALHRHPGPIPAIGDLQTLETNYQTHRRAQRFIYATILDTLKVGASMHYARRVRFGAGLRPSTKHNPLRQSPSHDQVPHGSFLRSPRAPTKAQRDF